MKKRVFLVIAAIISLCALVLVSLIGCSLGNKGFNLYDGLDTEYTKVHVYGIGCVEKEKTKLLSVGNDESLLLKYTDKYGDEFTTTEFALVKGACPICKK